MGGVVCQICQGRRDDKGGEPLSRSWGTSKCRAFILLFQKLDSEGGIVTQFVLTGF